MSCDAQSLSEEECLARAVVSVLAHAHRNITSAWERTVSDCTVSDIALFSVLHDNTDLIYLKLPKLMAARILQSIKQIRPNFEEIKLLLLCASRRRNAAALRLCEDTLIAPHITCVESALQFTLKEPIPAQTWSNPSTKLACVFSFHMFESPLDVLHTVFGSIVRADIRRCEDLHDCKCAHPLDTLAMCKTVECLSSVLVL